MTNTKDPFRFYVYAYTRQYYPFTPYYIGKGMGNRAFVNHRKDCKGVHTPIDKSRIVFLETNLSEIGALALERRYIEWYGRKSESNGVLLNITAGGQGTGGYKHSEETKYKIRKSNMGKPHKPTSDEVKAKISKKAMGRLKSESTKEKMRKPKSDSHKKKISDARLGMKFTNEHKDKLSVRSSKYKFTCISPQGDVYITHSLKKLAIEFNLCTQKLWKMRNKGVISKHRIDSSEPRINSTGWEIKAVMH